MGYGICSTDFAVLFGILDANSSSYNYDDAEFRIQNKCMSMAY